VDAFEPGSQATSIAAARGKISLRNAPTDKWPARRSGRKTGKVRGRGRNISGEENICIKAAVARVVQRMITGEDNSPPTYLDVKIVQSSRASSCPHNLHTLSRCKRWLCAEALFFPAARNRPEAAKTAAKRAAAQSATNARPRWPVPSLAMRVFPVGRAKKRTAVFSWRTHGKRLLIAQRCLQAQELLGVVGGV